MTEEKSNFIWDSIRKDLDEGVYTEVHTRFPPEPNGYMHIGHCTRALRWRSSSDIPCITSSGSITFPEDLLIL